MSNDTLIDNAKYRENEKIPTGFLPKQYEIETNIYCAVQLTDGDVALLVVHPVISEANNAKQHAHEWSAFSTKTISRHAFAARQYGDLVNEMKENIIPNVPESTTIAAESAFLAEVQTIVETEQLGTDEIHLRTSSSNLSWTAYSAKTLVATSVKDISAVFQKLDKNHALLPLDQNLSDILKSGHYNGCKLNEDLVRTLKDPVKLNFIKDHAIS